MAADEEAGDDKEHIDADKSSRYAGNSGVKEHHGENGDGAKAIDVRTIVVGRF